ncbi:MAG: hypothetical protein HGA52_04495 [Bacteroidales bacterium]|nr:hypothetical protein [Bacteroidales bacterium]
MAASEKLGSVMRAVSTNKKNTGKYFVYRKGKSYRIVSPSNQSHTCPFLVQNEEGVKSKIWLIFKAKVKTVMPGALF